MKRFFFIAIIAFATFNLNFVARYATGAAHGSVCQAHGGVCPHHRHHDKTLVDDGRSHGEHHRNAHHGHDNEKSYKCDCKKDYENAGLYTIPLPSQTTILTSIENLRGKTFEIKTLHSNQSHSPPETPPRA